MGSYSNYESKDYIRVKQINLHHAKSATALISSEFAKAQTFKQKLVVLIQEPYFVGNNRMDFDLQKCNLFCLPKGDKARTCIAATKDIPITILPQFCNGDITTVLINIVRYRWCKRGIHCQLSLYAISTNR